MIRGLAIVSLLMGTCTAQDTARMEQVVAAKQFMGSVLVAKGTRSFSAEAMACKFGVADSEFSGIKVSPRLGYQTIHCGVHLDAGGARQT